MNFVTIWIWMLFIQETAAVTNEDRLVTFLLNATRYSPTFRPVINHSARIVVHHGLVLKMISNVDEKNMVLTTNVILKLKWGDELLKWNPVHYGGVTQINLASSDIWTPPIILYNKANNPDEMNKPRARVKHDGNVTWLVPTVIQSSCDINVKHFPFDDQICKLIFGSWDHDVTKLNIQSCHSKVDTTRYLASGEWTLLRASAERTQVSHLCCRHAVARITYSLHIKRRPLFYTINFILPCAIIAFLTLLVFLTPEDTGERMAVGVTILLALAVFFLMLEATMPISDVLPLLAKYYCCTVIEISFCLVAMSWILRFVHHSPQPLPNWVKKGVLRFLARFVFYDTGHSTKAVKIQVQEKTDVEDKVEMKFAMRWKNKIKPKSSVSSSTSLENQNEFIKILAENVKDEEATDEIKGQWRLVANVLNRFFTGLFLVSALVTILAVYLSDVFRE